MYTGSLTPEHAKQAQDAAANLAPLFALFQWKWSLPRGFQVPNEEEIAERLCELIETLYRDTTITSVETGRLCVAAIDELDLPVHFRIYLQVDGMREHHGH